MQINGSTRDVFYYPEGTVSVRVVGPDVNIGVSRPTARPRECSQLTVSIGLAY
jgi:hypothetical protein